MTAAARDFEVCGICIPGAAIMRSVRSTTVNIDRAESAAAAGRTARLHRVLPGTSLIVSGRNSQLRGSFASSTLLALEYDV
jgi:hypothetical protein